MPVGPHSVLVYDYVADILERRGAYREAHLARIDEWIAAGTMLWPAPSAIRRPARSSSSATWPRARSPAYADGDPYVAAGLVTARRIEPWTVVRSRD